MLKKTMLLFGAIALTGCTSSPYLQQTNNTATCEPINKNTVIGLFDRWNASLQTGDYKAVVKNYADDSILIPTLSAINRITQKEKEDYFKDFLAVKPTGTVTARVIDIGCNRVTDSGLYTFLIGSTGKKIDARYTFAYKWTGKAWLISSHHSSILPASQ